MSQHMREGGGSPALTPASSPSSGGRPQVEALGPFTFGNDDDRNWFVFDADESPVALVMDGMRPARLFAAASDLLEALKAALPIIASDYEAGSPQFQPVAPERVLALMRAAVAKAEGNASSEGLGDAPASEPNPKASS